MILGHSVRLLIFTPIRTNLQNHYILLKSSTERSNNLLCLMIGFHISILTIPSLDHGHALIHREKPEKSNRIS